MNLRRVGGVAALIFAGVIWLSCGQVYRPVVIPINTIPPNASNFHAVFSVNANVPFNQGTALQIDVSGDSEIGAANMGVNPTHGASLQNNSRVYVASAGSLFSGDADLVTAVTPAVDSSIATGMGNTTVTTMPYGSQPVFVSSTENLNVYVANYATNSVSQISAITGAITLTGPVGTHPVALAETVGAQNLYVANQSDNTITDLGPSDLTVQTTIPIGINPTWMLLRPDGQRLYVVTQGDGMLYTINTGTNALAAPAQSLNGPGANFLIYDSSLNRLYVTNPGSGSANGAVFVYDATTDPPTPLVGASGLSIPAPPPCVAAPKTCGPVTPTSVAALPDGTRFYVASYAMSAAGAACPDANLGTASCFIPQVTVFDAPSLTFKTTVFPLLPSVATSPSGLQPFAVSPVAYCTPGVPYSPSFARFRMSAAAAPDSTHVYASICDSGLISDIVTTTNTITQGSNTPDVLLADLVTPFGACGAASCSTVANITAFQITSNIATFRAANQFAAGQTVKITGLTKGTYLDGVTLTVLGTGLSPTQFECAFNNPNVSLTTDSGSATPLPPGQNPVFLFTGQ